MAALEDQETLAVKVVPTTTPVVDAPLSPAAADPPQSPSVTDDSNRSIWPGPAEVHNCFFCQKRLWAFIELHFTIKFHHYCYYQ